MPTNSYDCLDFDDKSLLAGIATIATPLGYHRRLGRLRPARLSDR